MTFEFEGTNWIKGNEPLSKALFYALEREFPDLILAGEGDYVRMEEFSTWILAKMKLKNESDVIKGFLIIEAFLIKGEAELSNLIDISFCEALLLSNQNMSPWVGKMDIKLKSRYKAYQEYSKTLNLNK